MAQSKKAQLSAELRKLASELRKTADERNIDRLTKLAQLSSATLALELLARKIG
jgi:hypothetical protein